MEPTQGPYTVEHGSKGQMYVVGPNSDSMICEVPRLHPRAEANAALLAASWEMKEALEHALGEAWHEPDCPCFTEPSDIGCKCWMAKAEAALAKATQIT